MVRIRQVANPDNPLGRDLREDLWLMHNQLIGTDLTTNSHLYYWWLGLGKSGDYACFAGLYPKFDGTPTTAFLGPAAVAEKYRGQGLQRRLIRARVTMARKLGIKRLVTYVVRSNEVSANNLIRCGFSLYLPKTLWGGETSYYFEKGL